MGAPFSVAILFKVAMAFSWFPDSTSYLALSGSHCGVQGTQAWLVKAEQNTGSQRHTHLRVEKVRIETGARELASNPGSAIEYIGGVTLSNYLTSLCLHFLIHKMGIIIDLPLRVAERIK